MAPATPHPLHRPDLRNACTRWLSGHPPRPVRAWMQELARIAPDEPLDEYGDGALVQRLESEVAALLGKAAACFVPKGVIAQQAALRAWCERSGSAGVILHPRCHVDWDEAGAYQHLHHLLPLRVGADDAPFTAAQLAGVRDRAGVLLVELPLRRVGFRLPPWDDLVAQVEWARARELPVHIDGARLWESAPHYGRSLAQIAALGDSVYVSLYKGLGALAGCVLAGSHGFLESARPWLQRHGGQLFSAAPQVLSALEGLRVHLPRMSEYAAHARGLAQAIAQVPGVRVNPDPPHTNGFQVHLAAPRAALEQAALELARDERSWLFPRLWDGAAADTTMGEVQAGMATLAWSPAEAAAATARLLGRARRTSA